LPEVSRFGRKTIIAWPPAATCCGLDGSLRITFDQIYGMVSGRSERAKHARARSQSSAVGSGVAIVHGGVAARTLRPAAICGGGLHAAAENT
jgi:hypothetical protein